MIFIFLPNGIGDLLMVVPLLRRLIAIHGTDGIGIVVASHFQKTLVEAALGFALTTVIRFDGRPLPNLRLLFKLLFRPIRTIYAPLLARRLLHVYFFLLLGHRVVAPATFLERRLLNITPSMLSQSNFDGHQVDYFIQFIALDMPEMDGAPARHCELLIRNDARPLVELKREVTRVVVGVSCGPLERHKIPSPSYFARLLTALNERVPIEVLLIGGAGDLSLNAEFKRSLASTIVCKELIDQPFEGLVGAMGACDLGVAGTTGQGHMMAAAGLPLLVLSGATDPFESGPYARRSAHVRHDLPCGPCYQENFRFGCGSYACMETLSITEGVNLAEKLLSCDPFGIEWHSRKRIGPVPVQRIKALRNTAP
jgi:ADP-heptose:LPS heptosyltransferase